MILKFALSVIGGIVCLAVGGYLAFNDRLDIAPLYMLAGIAVWNEIRVDILEGRVNNAHERISQTERYAGKFSENMIRVTSYHESLIERLLARTKEEYGGETKR